jgi:hypothetical protein
MGIRLPVTPGGCWHLVNELLDCDRQLDPAQEVVRVEGRTSPFCVT